MRKGQGQPLEAGSSPAQKAARRLPCPRTISRVLFVVLLGPALLLGAGHVWRFAEHSRAALNFAYPLDGLEGTLLFEARLLRAGEALYQPLQPDRFISAPYQPLSYVALAFAETFAYRGDAPPPDVTAGPIFQPGRTVSLIGMLAAGLFAGLAAWQLSRQFVVLPLLLLLWLGFAPVQLWATRIKPDPLALALSAAVLLTAMFAITAERARRGWLSAAAVLAALAFFSKQTALAAPLAVLATLLLLWLRAGRQQRHRHFPSELAWFGGMYAGLVGLGVLGLQLATGGQYAAHVWGLHRTEWWSYGLFRKYFDLMLYNWPLLLAGFAVLLPAWLAFRRRELPAGWLLLALYVGVAVPTLLAAGAEGAHHNHLLEPYLALSVAASALVGLTQSAERLSAKRKLVARGSVDCVPETSSTIRAGRRPGWLGGLGVLALLLIMAQLWMLRERPAWYGGEFDFAQQERSQFIRLIQSQPGEVLADDVALLLAAGRPLRYDDPSTMGPAIRSGIWNQQNLLDEVAAQQFDIILLPFDATRLDRDPSGRWTEEFIVVLREHYELRYRDVLFTYVPRSATQG